jgi:hypothetical protein
MPSLERMPRRVVEEHIEIAFGGGQVSAEQRDRTSALAKRVAQRQRMANRQRIFHHRTDNLHRPIWKSQQPEDAGLEGVRRDALVELIARDVRRAYGRYVTRQHAVDMLTGVVLLADEMLRDADHPIAHQRVKRVRRMRRDAIKLVCERERIFETAGVQAVDPQTPQ